MVRLELRRTKVLYFLFLLVIPDVTIDARINKHWTKDDQFARFETKESSRELKGYEYDITDPKEDDPVQKGEVFSTRADEHVSTNEPSESANPELSSPKEKRWVSAIVTGTLLAADLACLGTIASNMGCWGLQKNICQLRKEVQQRYDRLEREVKETQRLEQTYDEKRDLALQASDYNTFILRKIRDSIDIAEKYLKLLAKIEQLLNGLPVLPAGFYTLDTRINTFIIDFKKVPDTASSAAELTAGLVGLGIELLPYVGKAIYRSVSRLRWPKAGDFDLMMKRKGKLYGLKGNKVFQINGKLKPIRRASFSEVSRYRQTQSFSKVKVSSAKTFGKALSKVGRAASLGLGMVGIALCGWQIAQIAKKNKEAETKLREQKKKLDDFIVDVEDSQNGMRGIIQNATELVGDYGHNFRILVETLVSSKTFKLVASKSERDKIWNVNKTATVETNLLSQQKEVYEFVKQYYRRMRSEYQNLVKVQHIVMDVEDNIGVIQIRRKLIAVGLTVKDKLEIFQIIARMYKNKTLYDGVDLNCIRSGKIKSDADLTKKGDGPDVSQDVAGQILMLAITAKVPPEDVAKVVKLRYKINLTNDQILGVIARETKNANFVGRNGVKYELSKYRKSSSC